MPGNQVAVHFHQRTLPLKPACPLPRKNGTKSYVFQVTPKIDFSVFLRRTNIEEQLAEINYLVVSTHQENMSQIGSFPQVEMKIILIFETTTWLTGVNQLSGKFETLTTGW